MKSRVTEIILISILGLVVIVALGFSMGLHSFTIIDWWKPVALCAIMALPVSLWIARYMRRLTQGVIVYLEYPAAFVLTFSILLAVFYSSNFFLSDHSSAYEYDAPVVRKYSQERTRSHKTGRRVYRTEKYTVYVIELEMKDGRIKKMEKTLSEYNKIKKGSTITLVVEDGLFSIPVIRTKHNNLPKALKTNNYPTN